MTTPENPFAGSDIPRVPHDSETPPEDKAPTGVFYAGVQEVFPSWGMLDILKIVFITIGSIFFTSLFALLVASALPAYRNMPGQQLMTDPRIIVPAQFAAYVIVLYFIYRIVTGYQNASFCEAIHWRWPHLQWPVWIAAGAVLAIGGQALQYVVPMPKQMPIDQLFRTASGAWIMAIFGVAIAPLVEELFFRGLLYPVLARKTNVIAGVLLTGFFFALLHASQLGKAWGPVFVLFVVGVALTFVRHVARSVAAAVLVHVGYNATLFSMLYAATDGFRHLEKLTR